MDHIARALLGILLFVAGIVPANADPLASSPPMGWNSWNHFADKVSDAVVRAQADAIVSSGLRDAGYVFINIDDTWEGKRDARGIIHPNAKFPDMKALADYVHGKGLKLGIYSSPGPKTCAGFEGSYGHEEQDAQTYAEWGVDYLKYDLCSFFDVVPKATSEAQKHRLMLDAYARMHAALQKTGRPIVYSLCQYGLDSVWVWGASVGGNLWRTTGDISDNYESMAKIGFAQTLQAPYAGPGHWNDPDMLEVGNGGMSNVEYQTHMSLWALLAAPLLAGNDLSTMNAQTIALLANREIIAIDQDAAGIQGTRVWAKGTEEVWAKKLADGSQAVGFFNRSAEMGDAMIETKLTDLGFAADVTARDVWAKKSLGTLHEKIAVAVPPHGVVLLRVQAAAAKAPEPIDFDDHAGYVQIFDGETLRNWKGDPTVWHVEDGAIVGEASKAHPVINSYLSFHGFEAKDFDLKLEIKVENGGGSGIQYRSKTGLPWKPRPGQANPNLDWMMTGPQADFWFPVSPQAAEFTGQFYSENTPLGILAPRGQVVESDARGHATLLGRIGDRTALGAYVKVDGWNQYLIVARGGTFMHIINGQLMAVYVDDDAHSSNNQSGLIGIEIEDFSADQTAKVYVRNIWIKRLRH